VLVKVSALKYEGHEGDAAGTLAFTIEINGTTGKVTVTQAQTLEHTTDGSSAAAHDDSVALGDLAAIKVVQKVTDGDGDFDTATSTDALVIKFEDDGPDAANDTDAVGADEAEAVGNVITGVSENGVGGPDTVGADGAAVTAIFSENESNAGSVGAVLSGEFGDLTLNLDGNYTYVRTASRFDGDDLLSGGRGNDSMTGGDDNDTFLWFEGETGIDTIADFNTTTEEDVLNIADLLNDMGALDGLSVPELVTALEGNYLSIATGTSTTVSVFSDGGGGTADQVIELTGYNTAGQSSAEVIESLLGSGSDNLIVS
jgi:hypothetical protein